MTFSTLTVALRRSILKGDVEALQACLTHGADADGAIGTRTCALALCSMKKGGWVEGARVLLDHGANVLGPKYLESEGVRVIPLVEAARLERSDLLVLLWKSGGGMSGLLDRIQDDYPRYLHIPCLLANRIIEWKNPGERVTIILQDILQAVADGKARRPVRPSLSMQETQWPWAQLFRRQTNPSVVEMVEAVFPFPGVASHKQKDGAVVEINGYRDSRVGALEACSENRSWFTSNRLLLERLLTETPAAWLLADSFSMAEKDIYARHTGVAHTRANRKTPRCLLERYAWMDHREGLRRLMGHVTTHGTQADRLAMKALAPELLHWACRYGRMNMVRDVVAACGMESLDKNPADALGQMLFWVLEGNDRPEVRMRMFHSLLEMGANPNILDGWHAVRKCGLVERVAQWGGDSKSARLLEALDQAGLDWKALDGDGSRAIDALEERAPDIGRRWRAQLGARALQKTTPMASAPTLSRARL